MKKTLIYTLGCALSCSIACFGQSDKVKFGAIGRGLIQESTLADDTLNPKRNNTANTVVDLRLNINPNKKTEIGTVVRMKSNVGSFYGPGDVLALRQLYLKGTIYNVVNYEVGDIYLKLSPYTLYNNDAEGAVNEASVFSRLRNDYAYYDNFNIGNSWWTQGGHVNFGLDLDSLGETGVGFDLFTSRIKAPNSMRFMNGAKVSYFTNDNYGFNVNAIQLIDAQSVNPTNEGINNTVVSLEGTYRKDIGNNYISVTGELGASNYLVNAPLEAADNYLTPEAKKGQFFTLKTAYNTNNDRIKVGARYLQNSANFLSAGAQSKRVNYLANPQVFQNVANDPFSTRSVQLYDLVAETSIYNPVISSTLMTYDPKYGNALPYGMATPNRTGFMIDADYKDSLGIVDLGLETALLSDVIGVGTAEKRQFTHLKAEVNLKVNKLIGFKRGLKLYGGTLYNKTTRGGDVAAIDLTTMHVDAGLDVEVISRLYIVLGAKLLNAKGNEFLYDLSNHNEYTIPTFYKVDGTETLIGAGFRYEFTDNMYLSIKNLSVDSKNSAVSNGDYNFNQWMLFFSLKL